MFGAVYSPKSSYHPNHQIKSEQLNFPSTTKPHNMSSESEVSVYLSIVVPLFNEEENVQPLLEQLVASIQPLEVSYEIILVDDGSRDGTWSQIEGAHSSDVKARGIRLARNFGHQNALLAGLSVAKGQAIVSMDGDLQHPPSLIGGMIKKYREGYAVVNTCRDDVEVTTFFKRTTSRLFYKLFSFLTNVPMAAGLSDFRLIDRSVLDELLRLQDVDLFLRGAVEWLGFPSVTVPYKANDRFAGETKYTLRKMSSFAIGSIISFSTKPLKLGIWLGVLTSICAFLEILYILYQALNGRTVAGWASTVGIISFLFGILFIILGIVGTYLARIHVALQKRPRYIITKYSDGCD
jgi:glycosyltransferase involved in cell wall biosynthesis